MTLNMGMADRAIRATVAVLIAALYLLGMISGTVAIVLGVVAAIFVATSAVGFCPLYRVVGLKTLKS